MPGERLMKLTPGFEFRFTGDGGTHETTVEIDNLVIAGWTGRDKESTEKHIAELEAIGIARPKKTPCFYRASVGQLTTADSIQVIGTDSSGEVEFFLLALEDGLWVGVGSDHTDRKVEAYDVAVSKQMCAKPIGSELWRFEDVADHWDELILRSTLRNGEDRQDYQEGTVANMLPPDALIRMYSPETEVLESGTLMYCGTLAVKGAVRSAEAFEAELFDPVRGRRITCNYRVVSLPPEE
jgi:hypothetical protein